MAPKEGPYASPTPQYIFAVTLEEQEAQLKENPIIHKFAELRRTQASDLFRPAYHFISPENMMNDPNGLSYWQGRWHLFYQGFPSDSAFSDPKDFVDKILKRQVHWGHAVSDDLVHWRDLPYAIYPGIEKAPFSGNTLVEKDRVIAFYPGIEAGQMIAISSDPLLLNWTKSGPVKTDVSDSDIWKEGDYYYGLTSGFDKYRADSSFSALGDWVLAGMYGVGGWIRPKLWVSRNLREWQPLSDAFLENTPLTSRYDEGTCPNFRKIGDKYILIFFSHKDGGQYLLGDYETASHTFKPYDHGRFNHGQVNVGGVLAPSAREDGSGGVINILSINESKQDAVFDEIMSLPQRLTLGEDKRLRIEPVSAVETLRGEHRRFPETMLFPEKEMVLPLRSNVIELSIEIDTRQARWVQLNVLRSANAEERTSITFYPKDNTFSDRWYEKQETIVLDGSSSSILPNIWARPPEIAAVNRANENLKLRVFVDRSVVEVFANGRQYLAMRVYPGRKDSLGISLKAHGEKAVLKRLDAWQMKPIWPMAPGTE